MDERRPPRLAWLNLLTHQWNAEHGIGPEREARLLAVWNIGSRMG